MPDRLPPSKKLVGVFHLFFQPRRFRKAALNAERTDKIRRQTWASAIWVASSAVTGAIAALWMGETGYLLIAGARGWVVIVSLFLLLWSTFIRLGWEIQTFNGKTYGEQINAFSFRLLAWLGTAVGSFATLAP